LADVAADLGVDPATLSRWESGRSRPRRDAALRWLSVLLELDAALRDEVTPS